MRGGVPIRRCALAVLLGAALVCVPSALAAPPPNDDLADARGIVGTDGSETASNVEATKEPAEPAHAGNDGGASIWFRWTAPRSGRVLIDTCASGIATLLAVYTGGAYDELDLVASDFDCADETPIEIAVGAGEMFSIAADGVDGAEGAIVLRWAMRPVNDDFADATALSGWSVEYLGSNRLATHEAQEPLHAGGAGSGSVWFRWTAPSAGLAAIETCDSDFDTLLAVYTGPEVGRLTAVAWNDDGCDAGSYVEFETQPGVVYMIAVDGYEPGVFGGFALRLRDPGRPPLLKANPTVSGTRHPGEVLTGHLGSWGGSQPITYDFWWERLLVQGWAILSNTRGQATYTAPLGEPIRFAVRATNRHGTATAYSDPVTIVAVPPSNRVLPTIDGTPRVGQILSVGSRGEWGGTGPLSYAYEWLRCERRSPESCIATSAQGPTAWAYTLTRADLGSVIRVRVNVSAPGGPATAVSEPVGPVVAPPVVKQAVCRVPRLAGLTLKAARASLARNRCRLGKVSRVRSAKTVGRIVWQSPKPGARLRAGGRVNVRLSLGRR